MSDIIIGRTSVKMTIEYEVTFNNDEDRQLAVDGALELRGLVDAAAKNDEGIGLSDPNA